MTRPSGRIDAVSTVVAARRRRLAKVEALLRAAGTAGEAEAATLAAARVRSALGAGSEPGPQSVADADRTFALGCVWSGRLLAALCRRYGIEPLDDGQDGTMTVRAPRMFLETVLVPEFEHVERALAGVMGQLTVPVATKIP